MQGWITAASITTGCIVLLMLASCPGFSHGRSVEIKNNPHLRKAESAFESRQFHQAIQYGELAIRDLDSIRDVENVVKLCNLLASSYTKIRVYDKVLPILSRAIRLSGTYLSPEHFLVADTHFYMGVYYDMMGAKEKTIAHHQFALDLRLKHFGPQHPKVADSYNGLGEAYTFTMYNYKRAIFYYEKGARIREDQLNPGAYDLYASYLNLSQAYRMLEDADNALVYAFKALAVVQEKKEHFPLLEKCYILLGDIYAGKMDYPPALEYFKKGIEHSIAISGPENYRLIQSYMSLGLAYGELNELRRAIQCFKKSMYIYSLHQNPDPGLQANNFLHLGRMFQQAGKYDSAKVFFLRNLKVRLENSGIRNTKTGLAYRYMAKFFQATGQLDSAAFYVQKALIASTDDFEKQDVMENPDVTKVTDANALFELFADKGNILLDIYHRNPDTTEFVRAALECFKISDALMELNRSAYHQEGAKLFFADHYQHIYEKGLQAAYLLFNETQNTDRFAEALTFMEKCKAILLAESLNKAETFSSAGLPDSLRELERNLNTALATYRSQLESIHQKPDSEALQQRIQSQLFDISQKQEKLLDTIAHLYPNYFEIKYQKLSSLDQIRAFARENNATIIEYFWGEENIYAMAISGKQLTFREITSVDSVGTNVLKYFKTLQRIPTLSEQANSFEAFQEHSHSIYNYLLAPLLGDQPDENIVIIRDGPLLLIPFESLLVSKSIAASGDYRSLDYLMRHHTISYAHSADLLLKNASRIRFYNSRNKILAFSYSGLNTATGAPANRSMNELPGAAREIQAISEILPGSFFLGEEATEEKFKTNAGEYDILHLAVHGKSDPEKQFSGTLYFKRAANGQEDGQLHVYELYDLDLRARLAVLSACESGVGKIFRGEGVFNIARGFAYAGCPSTVMTLWPVSDISSAEIMADFYRSLANGDNVDAALRKAKLNYLENSDPNLAHPTYWAAYIPSGNMAPVIGAPFPIRLTAMIMLVITAILAILLKYRHRRRLVTRQPVKA